MHRINIVASKAYLRLALAIFFAVLVLSFFDEAAAQAPTISFLGGELQGDHIGTPTSLQFGPDGRLYASQQDGKIYAYVIERLGAANYEVTESLTQEILLVQQKIPNHNDDGTTNSANTRQVTGLYVTGTGTNPVVYVSSSDSRIGAGGGGSDVNLDTNSGVISRLTWIGTSREDPSGYWEKVDLVRGLPRSEENHSSNGLALDESTNMLYLAQGGHTNSGAPSANFAFSTEYALSAAIVSIDLDAIEAMPIQTNTTLYSGYIYKWVYDLPTLDDPTRSNANGINNPNTAGYNGIDPGDPFGGNDGLNQAKIVIGGPVQIHSDGYRNPYDVIITQSGRMYTVDNGANEGWGGHPSGEIDYPAEYPGYPGTLPTVGTCTQNYIPGEPGSLGTGPGGDDGVNNENGLHYVRPLENGEFNFVQPNQPYYAGHPAPIRGNPVGAGLYTQGTHTGPLSTSAYWRNQVLATSDPNFSIHSLPVDWPPVPLALANPADCDFRNSGQDDNTLANYGPSTNGLAEYTASNFDGAMQGDLLVAAFNGNVYRAILSEDGKTVTNCPTPPFNGVNTLASCSVPSASFVSVADSYMLDVAAQGDSQIFGGTVWVAAYGTSAIFIFEPADYDGSDTQICEPEPTNDALDSDGDGYTDKDETDNGSNTCSPASKPADFDGVVEVDGFKSSNLNDEDDDQDGIPDVNDSFAWDATNGSTTNLPITHELFNYTGYGFGSLGFTGLMTNGSSDYLTQYPQNDTLIFGGTAGLFTIPVVTTGDALGATNTQQSAFQFGVNVSSATGPFTIRTRIESQFFSGQTPGTGRSLGLQMGAGDQSNYLKLVLKEGGFQVVKELGNTPTVYDFPIANFSTTVLGADDIDLYLIVDPVAGTVQPAYALSSGPLQLLGVSPITITGALLNVVQGNYSISGHPSKLAVGTISTSAGHPNTFAATWDIFYVIPNGAPIVQNPIADVNVTVNNPSTTVDLFSVFADEIGVTALTYSAVSSNENIVTTSIEGNILTLNYVPDALGTASVTVTATDIDNLSTSDTFQVSIESVQDVIYRINAGGSQYIDAQGHTWIADNYFVGGSTYDDNPEIANTVDDILYQSERYADFLSYAIPVPQPGEYSVKVHFAEIYHGVSTPAVAPGQRVFNLSIEGQPAFTNYDIFAGIPSAGIPAVGPATAVIHSYGNYTVTDGFLDLYFVGVTDNAKISAIEVLGTDSDISISASPIPDQTSIEGDSPILFVSAFGGDGNLAYSATGLPPDIAIEPTNGHIFGSIAAGAATGGPGSNGIYPVSITIDDDDADNTDTVTLNFTWTVTQAGNILYRVNAGGPVIPSTDSGPDWSADLFESPSPYVPGAISVDNINNETYSPGPTYVITANTTSAPDDIYKYERWDPQWGDIDSAPEMTWSFPVTSGESYIVNLYFAENWSDYPTAGPRLFDISIDGVQKLDEFEIFDEAGGLDKAVVKSFSVIAADSSLDIEFLHSVQNPKINGIEIITVADVIPSLVMTPASQTFNLDAGQTDTGTFAITTNDSSALPGDLNVFAIDNGTSSAPTWLTVNVSNDGYSIDATGLAVGSYSATLTANGTGYLSDTMLVTLNVSSGLPEPAAYVGINPPNTAVNGSTYEGGTSITNLSTDGLKITSVSYDLRTAMYPNEVFDPLGTAGDDISGCFDPTSDEALVGLVTPSGGAPSAGNPACTVPYSVPHGNGGFYVMSIEFDDFDPGETFSFAVDIDPTSIQGLNTTGAGGVSGLELAGTTVTITFEDGSILTTQPYRTQPSSDSGAENEVSAAPISAAPTVDVPTIASPLNITADGYYDGIITTLNQTVEISAPTGSNVSLLVIESSIQTTNPVADPFEANAAKVVSEFDATIGGSGSVSIPVALTNGDTGNHYYLAAVVVMPDGRTSNLSNIWRLLYDAGYVGNTSPTAVLGADATIPDSDTLAGESVTLNGSASTDSDGTIASYNWTVNGSPLAQTTATVSVNLPDGANTISLTVTDDDGATSAADTQIITVQAPGTGQTNVPPTAVLGADATIPDSNNVAGENVTLNGAASTDTDGTIVSYHWTVNGNPLVETTATVLLNLPNGVNTISLTVTDDDGATSAADTQIITVAPPGQSVASFTLINASSDTDLFTITEGMNIDLGTLLSSSLNVRANTSPVTVGSVVFSLTGAQNYSRTETSAPYALFGDSSGNYNTWTPPLGNYTLTATPYSAASGGGTAGTPLIVNFTVSNNPVSSNDGKVTLTVNTNQDIGGSTFDDDAFILTNNSPLASDTQITSLTIDLRTAALTDIIFDPLGAGNDLSLCFTAGSGEVQVGLITPNGGDSDPGNPACTEPYSFPHGGGYDVMTIEFNDFDPGEVMTFSADSEPNSNHNASAIGFAGEVCGYELTGSTITVTFSDGSTYLANLFPDGTECGGLVTVAVDTPAAPTIAAVGIPVTPATVSSAAQSILITGTPNANVKLLVMDSRLYMATGEDPYEVTPEELPYYSNEAMIPRSIISATIEPDGDVIVPITLFLTPGEDGTPDGGLNRIIAMIDNGTQNGLTSNMIVLKYDPTASNLPPTAVLGADLNVLDSDSIAGENITLDGSASTDSDGTIVSYNWTVNGNPLVETTATVLLNLPDGVNTISLTVTDDDGATSAADTQSITVEAPVVANVPPTAVLGADLNVLDSDSIAGENITLAGSASSDTDGTIVSYNWTVNGNPLVLTSVTVNVNLPDGVNTISLTVTDDDGATSAADTQTITVQAPATSNQLPTAVLGADATIPDSNSIAGESVTLDGTASTDSDGTIVAYNWTVNGNPLVETTATVLLNLPDGVNTISLTVTDDDGATSAADTQIITVQAPVIANVPPTAVLGADVTVLDSNNIAGENVTLAGTASTDSDGTIVSYNWTVNGSPLAQITATVNLNLPDGANTIVLTVTDDDGATSAADTQIITVAAPTVSGPIVSSLTLVNATSDVDLFNLTNGAIINLASLPSTDLNVRANTTPSPTGSVKFVLSGTQSRTHSENSQPYSLYGDGSGDYYDWTPALGAYTLVATPYTGTNGSGTAGIPLTINFTVTNGGPVNQTPTAILGADVTVLDSNSLAGESVTLDGSASSDSDGTIVAYHWTLNGSPLVETTATVLLNLPDGVNTISLTVTDNNSATSAADTQIITVQAPAASNQPPTAVLGADAAIPDSNSVAGESVTLDGSASTDSDGTITSYNWTVNGSPLVEITATVLLNLPDGVNTISLTVTDDDGATSAADTQIITVIAPTPANVPPTAVLGADVTVLDSDSLAGESVTLDGSASSDTDGTITTYNWTVNGSPLIETTATVLLNLPDGVNTISLTVTDDDGATSAADTQIITVQAPAASNQPPTAVLGADATIPDSNSVAGEDVTLDGSASTDSDGTITTYNWTVNGSPLAQTTATVLLNLPDGVNTISLTVTDDDGATSAADTQIITVQAPAASNQPPTAVLGADATIPDSNSIAGESVTLDGSASTDSDGTITSYNWTVNGSPLAQTTATVSVNLPNGANTISLTVTDDDGATSAADTQIITVQAPVASGPVLSSLTLVNATTDLDLFNLTNGAVIDLAALPTNAFNVRANTVPNPTGSVKFVLSGTQSQTRNENALPYTLFGDSNGNYNNWTPALGAYTLVATPYTGSNASGTAGTALTVNFTVISGEVPPSSCGVSQEAENAVLHGLFAVGNDGAASGGQYIHVPDGTSVSGSTKTSFAEFCLTAPSAGNYILQAIVYGSNGNNDSFAGTINDTNYVWDIPISSTFVADPVGNRGGPDPIIVTLSAGQELHVIVRLREDGAKLDKITLQPSSSAPLTRISTEGVITIDALATPAPIQTLSGVITPEQTTLVWEHSVDATWYLVWVGSADFTQEFHYEWHEATELGCLEEYFCTLTLPGGVVEDPGSYTWFVKAWGPGGYSITAEDGWSQGTFSLP